MNIHIMGKGGHAAVIALEVFGGSPDINFIDKGDPMPCHGMFTLGIGSNRLRKRLALELDRYFAANPGMMSYYNYHVHGLERSSGQEIGAGTVVLNGAQLTANTKIGKHCIINHGAIADHDTILEDFVHLSPGAKMLGGAKAREGAWIGAGAVVLVGAEVPAWAIVRANSVFPADYRIDAGYKGGKAGGIILKYQPEI